MTIKILVSIAGADFSFAAKQVAEIEDELAKKWIASGIAESFTGEEVETATAANLETPEKPKKRK